MLRPSMQTLKHISLIVSVHFLEGDPLCAIPSDLEVMRNDNVIESVNIKIVVDMDTSCGPGDAWGRLDEVLTTPGWFALKRVSLAIKIECYKRSSDELEVALENLPETQFPRLSTSDSVSFDFKLNSEWM